MVNGYTVPFQEITPPTLTDEQGDHHRPRRFFLLDKAECVYDKHRPPRAYSRTSESHSPFVSPKQST